MDPERWKKITEIFHAALARESGARAAFLADVCSDDAALRGEVETLLSGDARAREGGDPFARPAPSVAPGTALGPYRIEAALGAGGMGEVYKARDTRLNRSVAIKVLPSAFANEPELRQRFEREAQAIAALRHPHICVLYDIGHDQGVEFLVMEHLEGETLEQRLKKGPLPLDRALQYAIEIAEALHSAHRASITHRDLKPGNVMLTKDGAKLLDFGLAKFGARTGTFASATALPTTPHTLTGEGTIVGTFQYMAPEQLEGKDADARTDLFAFGAIVYEMITGRRAFTGDSRSNLIASILRDEPPPLSTIQPVTPPALDVLVRTCLAKDPDARLQSAHDAALQLRWIRDGVLRPSEGQSHSRTRPAGAWLALLGVLAALGMTGTYMAGRRFAPTVSPTLKKLTFRRGTIDNARFSPDGQTILYTAQWEGKPAQTFSMRLDTGQSVPIPVPDARLLAVSRSGELAILTKSGTLAQVPLGGEAPRELVDNVVAADWAPDGTSLAVLRAKGRERTIEYPIGKTLYTTSAPVDGVRLSPDGSLVAFIDRDPPGGGRLTVVDRSGAVTRLSQQYSSACGCAAWSGNEVWFSASEVGLDYSLRAVTRDGRERVVQRSPESLWIADVAPDGRVLAASEVARAQMIGVADGSSRERDLSWLDWSTSKDLSSDGKTLLFQESGVGAGPTPVVFLRKTDGSPAIRLTEGVSMALSPDGQWVLVRKQDESFPTIMPTGPGQSRALDLGRLQLTNTFAAWLPDNARIVFNAAEPGRPPRVYVQSTTTGSPRPITPEGVRLTVPVVVSPDSRVVTTDSAGQFFLYHPDREQPDPLEGLARGDNPLRWSVDGKALWLSNSRSTPIQILRFDLATRTRTVWREIAFADPAGLVPNRVLISADGQSYVYGFARGLASLYMIDGLR